jgi:hypothetical protein
MPAYLRKKGFWVALRKRQPPVKASTEISTKKKNPGIAKPFFNERAENCNASVTFRSAKRPRGRPRQ